MAVKKPCTHWWVIEAPNGGKEVNGKCKKCRAKRLFKSNQELQENELSRYRTNKKTKTMAED